MSKPKTRRSENDKHVVRRVEEPGLLSLDPWPKREPASRSRRRAPDPIKEARQIRKSALRDRFLA